MSFAVRGSGGGGRAAAAPPDSALPPHMAPLAAPWERAPEPQASPIAGAAPVPAPAPAAAAPAPAAVAMSPAPVADAGTLTTPGRGAPATGTVSEVPLGQTMPPAAASPAVGSDLVDAARATPAAQAPAASALRPGAAHAALAIPTALAPAGMAPEPNAAGAAPPAAAAQAPVAVELNPVRVPGELRSQALGRRSLLGGPEPHAGADQGLVGSAVALVRRALADTAPAPAPYPALDPGRYGSQYVVTSTGVAAGAGAARLTGEQALAAVRQIQARPRRFHDMHLCVRRLRWRTLCVRWSVLV